MPLRDYRCRNELLVRASQDERELARVLTVVNGRLNANSRRQRRSAWGSAGTAAGRRPAASAEAI